MAEPTRIEAIALAVADGREIDWEAEAGVTEDATATLNNLRLVADLSRSVRARHDATALAQVRDLNRTFNPWLAAQPGTEPEPRQPPREWCKLEIRERIGTGAHAHVYRAWDAALHRDVALKLYHRHDPRSDEWLEEGRRMARIVHPGVVRVYGADRQDDQVGLWMEWLSGESLEARLSREGPLEAAEIAQIGIQLCEALDAIHRAGVVHGDIKPDNVLRGADGRSVLSDFGSGTSHGEAGGEVISGTPLYMAPELLAGGRASPASDQFALGVLLYRAASGRYPYEADSVPELIRAHRAGAPAPLAARMPEPDGALTAIIDRACAVPAGERFPSIDALRQALQARFHSPGKRPLRHWASWFFPAIAIVLVWVLWPQSATQPTDQPAVTVGGHYAATWFRRSADGREPLQTGSGVYLGDGLELALTLDQPMYAWVFSEDSQGRSHALFPIEAFGHSNPLQPGASHRLPGHRDGQEFAWQVDSPAEWERIHVLIGPEPHAAIVAAFSQLPAARLAVPGGVQLATRGVGSLAGAGSGGAGQARSLLDTAKVLTGQSKQTGALTLETIELRNLGTRTADTPR